MGSHTSDVPTGKLVSVSSTTLRRIHSAITAAATPSHNCVRFALQSSSRERRDPSRLESRVGLQSRVLHSREPGYNRDGEGIGFHVSCV